MSYQVILIPEILCIATENLTLQPDTFLFFRDVKEVFIKDLKQVKEWQAS